MKKPFSWIVLVTVCFTFFLQGCAANKSLVKQDLEKLVPLKVCCHETPSIRRSTLGGRIFGATAGVLLAGGLGAGLIIDSETKSGGKEAQSKIYDFGNMIMTEFVARVNKEIPNWPTMTVLEKPVSEDYTEQTPLLEFKVTDIMYGYRGIAGSGFQSITTATIKDSKGELLWRRTFNYSPNDFNRKKSIDELEADDYKLLKEELEFAAEKTAVDFIENLKAGL